jgi:hypothetical protein
MFCKEATTMGKKRSLGPAPGEQMDLIDVGPENLEKIKPTALAYRDAMQARMKAGETEQKHKQALLELVREANLHPNEQGIIKFKCGGLVISVTPRDELIQVKDANARKRGRPKKDQGGDEDE